MRILITLVLALYVVIAHAQLITPPGKMAAIQSQKTNLSTPVVLFDQVPTLRSGTDVEGLSLQLRPQAMRLLQQQSPAGFTLPLPAGDQGTLELELVKVNIFSADFKIVLSGGGVPEPAEGIFYQGKVKGKPGSLAAVSIFDGEVMALISTPNESNLVISKEANAVEGLHRLYQDDKLPGRRDFDCYTEDGTVQYRKEDLVSKPSVRAAGCTKIYFEVDNDVFVDKGGQDGTVKYMTALFNEVVTLYAAESIPIVLSQIFVWNTPSPYASLTNTGDLLNAFQRTRTSFNGDLGQLISYRGNGGIAVVDGLCRSNSSYKQSYAGIGRSFSKVPTFSFPVMVIAHELGHLFGSQHTHACAWNGNNTAIDGCPGFVEGSCATPTAPPTGGGTIMSYCHLSSVGINFSQGFGPQPGNLMRSRVAAGTCLTACTTTNPPVNPPTPPNPPTNPPSGGTSPTCLNVTVSLTLDMFGTENTWEIADATTNKVVQQGGPYANKTQGQKQERKMCLPFGCYIFKIKDAAGDGMCCTYGSGGFKLIDSTGKVLLSGDQFGREASTSFCLVKPGGTTPPTNPPTNPPTSSNCVVVDFTKIRPQSFGGAQDQGQLTVIENGKGIMIENNAWKAIPFNYNIVGTTVLKFEFKSTRQGEINGIGFDDDDNISSPYTFELFGTQIWGNTTYKDYDGSGNWKTYTIPVGQFYTGAATRLFFAADFDEGLKNGNSFFRNIQIYDGTSCISPRDNPSSSITVPVPPSVSATYGDTPTAMIFPNPATDQTQIKLSSWPQGKQMVEVMDLTGKQLKQFSIDVPAGGFFQMDVPIQELPAGAYIYRVGNGQMRVSGKLIVNSRN